VSDIIGDGVVDRVTAEHVLAGHLAALGGQSDRNRCQHQHTIRQFLADLTEPRDDVGRHLVLSESRLLHWLIDDARGRPVATLRTNLTALGRYSQALASAGLVARDLLAALRVAHGNLSHSDLAQALCAPDAEAGLAVLRADPLPTAQHAVNLAEAKSVLEHLLTGLQGRTRACRNSYRRMIGRLFAGLCEPPVIPGQCLLLDEPRLLQWLVRDVAGRTLPTARARLRVLSRYLHALTQAGLLDADPLAEFRARHGNRSWEHLIPALQSADPQAALAALRVTPLPPGPLATHVRSYVELHRALGKQFDFNARILEDFDDFLRADSVLAVGAVTQDHVGRWLDAMTCNAATRRVKARAVRRFFAHLHHCGVVPMNPILPASFAEGRLPTSSFRPFIFTPEQVAAVLDRARRLPQSCFCPFKPQTCYTMLVLLYALGLRHGEVRRLCIRNVDFTRAVLSIRQTKFHKSRYVPFGPKVGKCLRQFLDARRTVLQPLRDDDPLFVTLWRAPVRKRFLMAAFHGILHDLGITAPQDRRRPRLHDLRHSFAVHRLLRWYREGVDVQARLPLLSAFLGHVEPKYTAVYLTATAELLREANERFYRHASSLFNEEVSR
jgi:integrase/recombinase XerD